MPVYIRGGRVRGTLFPADEPAPAALPMPRVLRGADAARAASPAAGPLLVPRVLRGAEARHAARPFEVSPLTPTPDFLLSEPAPVPEAPPAPPPPRALDEDAIRADEAAQWHARLEEAATRARENGYRQGREDAERATADERAMLQERVSGELEALKAAWRAHLGTCETMMAQLAFEVAGTIVSAPLPDNVRRVSARAIHEAVESLADSPVVVTVHPVDLLRLQETGTEDELGRLASEVRIEADPFLHEGDWRIETPSSSVRHLRDELLDALRRRLGLLGLGKG